VASAICSSVQPASLADYDFAGMKRAPFQRVPRAEVKCFRPGEEASRYVAGDFILTHGDAWTSKLIRFGQRLRIHGDDRRYTHWNHAAVITSDSGDLIEALGAGVTRTHISKYTAKELHLVRVGASPEDRKQTVDFARWAAGLTGGPRHRYGFLTIVSIAYTLLTGGKFTFAIDGEAICSGLVARAMERTGAIFNRTPTHVMPADLAKYYDVEPPTD
jgi:uncharacterized protein YycO